MSNIDKLKSAAAKAVDNFDPNMFVETRDVLALLDELEDKDKRIAELEVVKELFLRAKALMYQSGGTPIENSLNPIDAWLNDAERAAMLQGAEPAPATDNTAQQFEALATSNAHDCLWSYDSHQGTWHGKCGVYWVFMDDGPDENGMKFCPGCGKPVSTTSAASGKQCDRCDGTGSGPRYTGGECPQCLGSGGKKS